MKCLTKAATKRVTHGMIPFIYDSKSGKVNYGIDAKKADTWGHEKDI